MAAALPRAPALGFFGKAGSGLFWKDGGLAAWCRSKPEMCGLRLSTTPHFSGGYIFASREDAAGRCSALGMQLCRKDELVGHSLCEAGWCSG